MSVQFGRWNFDGESPLPAYIDLVDRVIAPYGPDGNNSYFKGGVKILYRAFHTTKESRWETQPYISASGNVITWDGRLDNRADLITELRECLTAAASDVAVVAAAHEKWGNDCFAKLIGDWTLSVWNERSRSLVLAKDPIGSHHLYYSYDETHVVWSTVLDPIVRFAGKTFAICEEYVAGWFASLFPAAHLTPYASIHAVPPSSYVLLRPGTHIVSKYWDFDPVKTTRYRTDVEYEEHFRAVLDRAVERKLRCDRPVLVELSGGMDSSSIVCTADRVVARAGVDLPRLDTVSWYDDSYDNIEPDWNERNYFSKVEEKCGRRGWHINLRELRSKEVSRPGTYASEFRLDQFAATPIPNCGYSEFFKEYAAYIKSNGYRVVLSGIGGDQATGGGLPTPKMELQDLLATGRFFTLAVQLKAWATKMRRARLPLLWEAAQGFCWASADIPMDMRRPPWFAAGFVRNNRAALSGYPWRVKLFGSLPSFQDNIDQLEVNRRFLAYCSLQSEPLRDVRYPYFDRDLLEFMFSIPREQVVRVGQRRSLMKRALVGIVPPELLNRRRKAFIPPRSDEEESKKRISVELPRLAEIGQHFVGASIGIFNPDRFLNSLDEAWRTGEVPIVLKRSLTLECWLRHLTAHGVLAPTEGRCDSSAFNVEGLQVPHSQKVQLASSWKLKSTTGRR